MRALAALLAVCLVGSGLGSWWLLGDADVPPAAAPADSADVAPAAAATPVAAFAPARADDAAFAAAEEPLAADDGTDDDLERTAVAAATRHAPRVQVLRGTPPLAVAGAVVWFVAEADARKRAGDDSRLGRWDWPQAFGQRATTGDDGTVQLPVAAAPWLCAAADGGDFGVANVPPRDRTFPIVLQRDEQVRLRVRADGGTPAAAVPVAIVQQFDGAEGKALWRGTTDRDGVAVATHFQLVRETRTPPPAHERFAALALVPGATAVPFAGRPPPDGDVELTLPPLARVALRLVDHAGVPVLSRAQVGLGAWNGPTFAVPTPLVLPRGIDAQRVQKPPGAAPVVLPFVEVGAAMYAYARFPGDRRPAELTLPDGPPKAGETLELEFPLRATQAVLSGRLLLAPDTPLASTAVDAALWTPQRDVVATTLDTIGDGRFDVVLAERTDTSELWLELRVDVPVAPGLSAATGDDAATVRVGARVPVPVFRGRTRVDVGTILLAPLAPCVHGVVVDDAGAPIAKADVQVQVADPPRRNETQPRWRPLPLYRTRTGDDGAFTIDGVKPPGTLRVHVDSPAHFADSVPLHTAGQQAHVVLARNGVLRGQVLLPGWIADGTASLQLRPFDESLRERDTRSVELVRRRGGRFTIEPLRPGRFDALVVLRNVPEPIAVVADVFVQPGHVHDPRLAPLDLRAALHRYRLRAVDAVGTPLALNGPILARFPQLDGTFGEAAFRWRNGRAELIAGSPTAEIVCFGRGHQTVRLQVGAGDSDVRLPATLPAVVEVTGARALCGPHRKVRVSVLLRGDTGLPGSLSGVDQRNGERFGFQRWDLGRSSGAWLGAGDTVEIPLMQSGTYEVLLRPHATDNERSPQGQVSLGVHELSIDGTQAGPLRLRLDAAAVLQELQRLDERYAQQQAEAQAPRPAGRGGR